MNAACPTHLARFQSLAILFATCHAGAAVGLPRLSRAISNYSSSTARASVLRAVGNLPRRSLPAI